MAETCYRHPDRETAVRCSNCDRPICPDCMTPSPVGMRCPECSRQTTKVVVGQSAFSRGGAAPATFVLIGLNVLVYLVGIGTGNGGLGSGGQAIHDFGLQGNAIADGEWFRIVSGGFLHAGLIHIAFNMFALYVLGTVLEPGIGTPRFVFLYMVSLLAGSLGALLLTNGNEFTVGASGAIFGIFGAAFVIARARGMSALAGEIGFLLLINLALTFGIAGISIGGHLGGLAGGMACAAIIALGERGGLGRNHLRTELALMAAIGIGCAVAAVAIS